MDRLNLACGQIDLKLAYKAYHNTSWESFYLDKHNALEANSISTLASVFVVLMQVRNLFSSLTAPNLLLSVH